jgi:hypothetical protein
MTILFEACLSIFDPVTVVGGESRLCSILGIHTVNCLPLPGYVMNIETIEKQCLICSYEQWVLDDCKNICICFDSRIKNRTVDEKFLN